MTSEERNSLFSSYVGSDFAKQLNVSFEKAMVDGQKAALRKYAIGNEEDVARATTAGKFAGALKDQFNPVKPEVRDRMLEKINKLDQILSPKENAGFLHDLAAEKMGATLTEEEAKTIVEKASNLAALSGDPQALSAQIAKEEGLTGKDAAARADEIMKDAMSDKPQTTEGKAVRAKTDLARNTFAGVTDEYLKARSDLDKYLLTLTPSTTKNLATIARNNLLVNPATPIKTIDNQLVNTLMDGMSRRLAQSLVNGRVVAGGANGDLARQFVGDAFTTFRKTGYNVGSMSSLDDNHMFRENFDTPGTNGEKGALGKLKDGIRQVAKVSNKVVITALHGAPFNVAYHVTFGDMANIRSTQIAKNEGLTGDAMKARAAEIFKDSTKIEPTTDEGKIVRAQSQEQAARVTSTNKTWASGASNGAKQFLNNIFPGVPLGDIAIPIAKIPATIIANGIDNAGVGLVRGAIQMHSGWAEMKDTGNPATFQKGVQTFVRTAGVMTAAALIASNLSKNDFKTDKYGVSSVKIGNNWVSLEYFAPIAPALAGFMAAKQGNSIADSLYKFGAGALGGVKNLPGIDEINTMIQEGAGKYATDFVNSRTVPSILNSFETTTVLPPSMTPNSRPINRLLFGAHGIETDQQAAQDTDASTQKATNTKASKALAGMEGSPLTSEVRRLAASGHFVNPDTANSTSTRLASFKTQVPGSTYNAATTAYANSFTSAAARLVRTTGYQNATDAKKAKMLTMAKEKALGTTLKQYGYRKTTK